MPASQEPNSGLYHGWSPGENGWGAGMEANLLRLGRFLAQVGVLSASLTTPPVSPAAGDRYVVATGATGAWAGHDQEIALWDGAAWEFSGAPKNGWRVFDVEMGVPLYFQSGAWVQPFLLHSDYPASSGQLIFPATQIPSANPNALDDYEEGIWQPVLTCATPGNLAVTYSSQEGLYRKIGDTVWYWAKLGISSFSHSTASGAVRITGYPFPAAASGRTGFAAISGWVAAAGYTWTMNFMNATGAMSSVMAISNNGMAIPYVQISELPSGSGKSIYLSGSYQV